jgi:hypothetical protein
MTMATFMDKGNRKWILDLNVTQLKRAKASGFDIPEGIANGKLLEQCCADEIYLVDLLYALCKEQADEREMSDEDFGRTVGTGPCIAGAVDALMEALTDFYQNRAEPVRKAMEKYREMETKAMVKCSQKIEEMDIDKMVEDFGNSLTNALVSAE